MLEVVLVLVLPSSVLVASALVVVVLVTSALVAVAALVTLPVLPVVTVSEVAVVLEVPGPHPTTATKAITLLLRSLACIRTENRTEFVDELRTTDAHEPSRAAGTGHGDDHVDDILASAALPGDGQVRVRGVDGDHLVLELQDGSRRFLSPTGDLVDAPGPAGAGIVVSLERPGREVEQLGSVFKVRKLGCGGLILAQELETAKQPDMPESAIDTGCIDFILSPEDIAREIVRIAAAE